jgi:hypothetical protein
MEWWYRHFMLFTRKIIVNQHNLLALFVMYRCSDVNLKIYWPRTGKDIIVLM